MIRGERPFSVVLPLFIEWLTTATSVISCAVGIPHYPGNFTILMAEIERRSSVLSLSVFEANRIHFGDTLPLLRKVYITCMHVIHIIMYYHRCERLRKSVTKLCMESLYMHVFKSELPGENIGNTESNLLCNSTGAHMYRL